MNGKSGESALWAHINQNQITKENIEDLTNFKSGKINFKIALWDPQVNGMRYLKTLIYNLSSQLSETNWTRLKRIQNRQVGNPVTIIYNNEPICMDYLQAVFELDFIANNINLDGMSIIEIGAGYGRTCHTIISNHNVTAYYIVDLENCLKVALNYLRAVLTDQQFSKICFVNADNFNQLPAEINFDLCINIDSFAEMNSDTVKYYLALINKLCRYLYVKNPVGKYLDKSLDGHSQGSDIVRLALSTGLLTNIIDIHNNTEVEAQKHKFVSAYKPCDNWKCLDNKWAVPWSYYWQAFYRNEEKNIEVMNLSQYKKV